MEQSRKKTFGWLLSRSRIDKDSLCSVGSTGGEFSALDSSVDKKGALGLTTLHDPSQRSNAAADIVFIHGLGGGSRKTWSHSPGLHHFWPRAWLPADPGFGDVRIHSFGYKADWGERRQSNLNIHDFAQSLIGELKNNPCIRRDSTRIILVGHSMGGCVAKLAYTLVRQDPTCKELAGRVHSIFFLGTPHRGSDMAAVLERILVAAWGKKPFVADLTPNSTALSMINDAFRHVAPDLHLWSFYETLPVRVGIMSRMVVGKQSATLDYANEEIVAMTADHQHVCKFHSPADPNYKLLRNSLHTAVDMIRAATSDPLQPETNIDSTVLGPALIARSSRLRSFLGFNGTPESDLVTLQGLKEPGSCQWLTEKTYFMSWKSGNAPGILWLTGKPAAGKSVLSGHVVEQLKPPNAYCSYFFYKHSAAGKSTLCECFVSLAFQMATQDKSVRERLKHLEDEGVVFDKNDEANVWRKLFVGNIFKLSSMSHHFWVIDGFDECVNFNTLFTKRLLDTLPEGFRIFATSRNLEAVERGLASLGPRASLQTLSDSDTLGDMRLFLTTKLRELNRLKNDQDCESMCGRILHKSRGSFLWARLVLQEFENAWTEEAMNAVLNEVPAGLHDLYSRMVQLIEADNRKAIITKPILTWIGLASRPLTLDELGCAIKLDLNQTLQNIHQAVPNLCGQLIVVDHSNHVHLIHETAREFLVSETLSSELAIDKEIGHSRLASLLLGYLCSDALKQQQAKDHQVVRPRGFSKLATTTTQDSSLFDYASRFFSDHLCMCSPESDRLMDELCGFLRNKNILSWIEHIAKGEDLNDIPRTAMNLRTYLARRAQYAPPTDPSVQLVAGWVTDLIRVAAKFRPQLLTCPSSIYSLIPHLCPSESMISRAFARNSSRSAFSVKGLPDGRWDDCLICIDFQQSQATAVCYGDRFFAVGLSTGQISLYGPASGQSVLTMAHPGRVKFLEFGPDGQHLVSCSAKQMVVWETKSGAKLHSLPLQSPPVRIAMFGANELICVFQSCELTKWCVWTIPGPRLAPLPPRSVHVLANDVFPRSTSRNLDSGQHESIPLKDANSSDYAYSHITGSEQPPSRAAFISETDDVLLATGYRTHPVIIWDVLELEPLGKCEAEASNGIDDMAFNPNPEIVALVVSYNDGRLCVFNYTNMELTCVLRNVFAQSIACSQNGRNLVTGSSRGVIEVFEFDQGYDGKIALVPIYRIDGLENSIRGVSFSPDGLRIIDVRGQQCRVWAPAALVRKNNEIETAPSNAMTLAPRTKAAEGMFSGSEDPEITSALVTSSDGRCLVAGKRGGTVALFSTTDGMELGVLYRHAETVSVVEVVLGEQHNIVISADDSSRVLVAKLAEPLSNLAGSARLAGQALSAATILFHRRFGAAVRCLLVNAAVDRLLVGGRDTAALWELPSGQVLSTRTYPIAANKIAADTSSSNEASVPTSTTLRSIFQHPTNPNWFIVLAGDIARIFIWSDFNELTPPHGIHLTRPEVSLPQSPEAISAPQIPNTSQSSATASYHIGPGFVVEFLRPFASAVPHLHVWPDATFNPDSSSDPVLPAVEPNLNTIAPAMLSVLGIVGMSTLMFLDVNLWVCSTELQSTSSTIANRSGNVGAIGSPPPVVHARRHFFALSEWRSVGGELRCALAAVPAALHHSKSRDVAFVNGRSIVMVKGGLEFVESLVAARTGQSDRQPSRLGGGLGSTGGQAVWNPVSGTMHRRALNW